MLDINVDIYKLEVRAAASHLTRPQHTRITLLGCGEHVISLTLQTPCKTHCVLLPLTCAAGTR
jgi:hypothetical protein